MLDAETFYTIPEAAAKLRVTRAAIYKWMKQGKLEFVIVGSERRVTGAAITAFIRAGREVEYTSPDQHAPMPA